MTAKSTPILSLSNGVRNVETNRALRQLEQGVRDLAPTGASVTGSRASGAALENLLTVLARLGIITNNTTA